MKILAIDTATEACSAALLLDDHREEIFEIIPRKHTERILPMIDELLSNSNIDLKQLDAIAFNCGPGSFTGVRVGTSVAQGLAFSADLPVIPVSSLAALAQLALRQENMQSVLSVIDARMNEVYWGYYQQQSGIMALLGEEHVTPADKISLQQQCHCLGSGWDAYQNELQQSELVNITSSTNECFPHALDIAILAESFYKQGHFVNADMAIPTYIRDEVTWKKISEQ